MKGFVKFVVVFVLYILSVACATTKPSNSTDDELRRATVDTQGYRGSAPEARKVPEPECAGCYCNEYGQWVGKDGRPAEINGQPIHCKPNTRALQKDDVYYLPSFGWFLYHQGLPGDVNAGHWFQKEDGTRVFCPFKPGCYTVENMRQHKNDEVCLDASLCYRAKNSPLP